MNLPYPLETSKQALYRYKLNLLCIMLKLPIIQCLGGVKDIWLNKINPDGNFPPRYSQLIHHNCGKLVHSIV